MLNDLLSAVRATLDAIRRNHALEHGTVMVMLGRLGSNLRLAGRATPDGFYIYGRVPEHVLLESAHEALARFKRGEGALAITPLCGTNIAVAGVLSGLASAVVLGRRPSPERLPNVFSAATLAVVVSQPAGRWIQQYLTTRPDLENLQITGLRRGLGGWVHKVETRGA